MVIDLGFINTGDQLDEQSCFCISCENTAAFHASFHQYFNIPSFSDESEAGVTSAGALLKIQPESSNCWSDASKKFKCTELYRKTIVQAGCICFLL